MKKTLTSQDLNNIRELAKKYYIEDTNVARLENELFNAQCWVKAVLVIVDNTIDIELPKGKLVISFDDENG